MACFKLIRLLFKRAVVADVLKWLYPFMGKTTGGQSDLRFC